MYIVGFSGPPRSGKDSLANMLAAVIEDETGSQPQRLSLSTPMREVTFDLAGIPYDSIAYEQLKDLPQPLFGGKRIRDVMIALSEEFVKPRYGHDFWAKSLTQRLWAPPPKMLIISDMGFDAERIYFEELVGYANCVWPWVFRDGCDFSKDSRSYVGQRDNGNVTDIFNNGQLESVATEAQRIYGRLVNQMGWTL